MLTLDLIMLMRLFEVYEQCVKATTKPDSKFGMKDGCSLLGHLKFQGINLEQIV